MASKSSFTSDLALAQRTVILFVDPTLINDHHIERLQYDFKLLTLNLLVFFESHECLSYLHRNPDESFTLIVGESNGEEIVRTFLSSPHLHRLFIVCSNPSQGPSWILSIDQSVPFFLVDVVSLSYRIRMDDDNERNAGVPFDVLSSSSSLSSRENLTNRQDGTFMCGQLFKYVLTKMTYTKEDMNNMIEFIEEKCSSRKISEQFRQSYTSDKALLYYTSETLFYSILNSALRTCNFGVIYTMGIFIKDLHNALVQIHKPLNKNEILHLYRGQVILKSDFERIRSNISGLMSINQFLSTSTARDVAEIFAMGAQHGKTGVLFHITVDETVSRSVSFANIKAYSKFEDEDEYLFTMGSVFRIHAVEEINRINIWCINLALTNDQDKEIALLTDFYRTQMKSPSLSSLCLVLVNMQEYDRLKSICEIGLKVTKNTTDAYFYCLCSGLVNCVCGKASKGEEHLQMAQRHADDLHSKHRVKGLESLTQMCIDSLKGDLTGLYSFAEEIRESKSSLYPEANEALSRCILLLNGLFAELHGNATEAKLNYSKAHEKLHEILPSLHPQLLVCQDGIERSKSYGDKVNARKYSMSGLKKIFSRTSLPDNPVKAWSESMFSPLECVSTVSELTSSHVDDHQHAECLDSLNCLIQQAVINHRQKKPNETLSATNKFFQSSEKSERIPAIIAYEMRRMQMKSYKETGQYAEALKSLHEMENLFNSTPLMKQVFPSVTLEKADILATLNEDEETFRSLDQYQATLSSHNVRTGTFADKSSLKSLANRFLARGSDHFERENYYEAIAAYEKALKILLDFMAEDYAEQIPVFVDMSRSFFALGNYSSALVNCYKVVDLLDKVSLSYKVDMATIWGIIGVSHQQLNEYDAALVAFNNRQEILSIDPCSNHSALASTHEAISLLYLRLRKSEEGIHHLEKVLYYRRNYSETVNPNTAEILKFLGGAYRRQGNFKESLSSYEQALEIYMTNCTDNPKIIDLYKRMALVHMEADDFSSALMKLEKCSNIHMATGSSDDLVDGLMDHCRAHILFKEKRYDDCFNHIERAIPVYTQYRQEIPKITKAFAKLVADTRQEMKRLIQIEQDAKDQILVHKASLQTFMEKEDWSEALFHAKKMLQIQVLVFPKNDLMILSTWHRICYLTLSSKRFSDSPESLEYCVAIGMKYLPKTISRLIKMLNILGSVYEQRAQHENAIFAYEDALEFQMNILPADHLDIAETYQMLGSAYVLSNEIDEGRSNFLKCLDIRTKKLPNDHPDLIKTREIVQRLF